MNKARLKEKDWLKIATFSVPIIAVVVGNALNMESTKELEDAIMLVLSAVLGLIGVIGVAKNNDKKVDPKPPLEQPKQIDPLTGEEIDPALEKEEPQDKLE